MTKSRYDPQRHHRRSIRLKGYDYAQAGAYFVTLVCQHRLCLLEPTPVRDLVQTWWDKLPEKFPVVETDEFVIMPNHIHGIIVIVEPDMNVGANLHVGAHPCVRPQLGQTRGSAPTLGRIVQWFKTMTTNAYIRGVKQNGWESFPGKFWQRNYYEHIIRNERELNAIRQYIHANPTRWENDNENPNRRR